MAFLAILRRGACTRVLMGDFPIAKKTKTRSPIMTRLILTGVAYGLVTAVAAAQAPQPQPQPPQPKPGTAEQIGEKIDRGLTQIGAELTQAWAEVRKSVEKMGVQGRVYGRLRWDKALEDATLEIKVRDDQAVVLVGKVASPAAKHKAEQLARDTVGVTSVVNELTIADTAAR
jgi:hyperosmotically inducible periplasmic protein